MKYVVYVGNPRKDKEAKKKTEYRNMGDAQIMIADLRNHGIDAYFVEVPERSDIQ